MTHYPLPQHAAYIWTVGDEILIGLPPTTPEGRGHTVRLPASAAGMARVLQLLRERERAERFTVGEKSCPTQVDLEHMANALMRSAKLEAHRNAMAEKAAERAEATELLKLVGLI